MLTLWPSACAATVWPPSRCRGAWPTARPRRNRATTNVWANGSAMPDCVKRRATPVSISIEIIVGMIRRSPDANMAMPVGSPHHPAFPARQTTAASPSPRYHDDQVRFHASPPLVGSCLPGAWQPPPFGAGLPRTPLGGRRAYLAACHRPRQSRIQQVGVGRLLALLRTNHRPDMARLREPACAARVAGGAVCPDGQADT